MVYELITPESHFDGVIFADGDCPTHPIPLGILRSGRPVIACDNAGAQLITKWNMLPDAIVGDGDSLPQQFKDRYKDIIHYVAEQDYNDLTKATRFFLEHYRSPGTKHPRICYIGCTGKREDHTLGNISLPTFYRQEFGVEGVLPTDFGWFVYCHGACEFESIPNQQVSIFNLNCSSLTSQGLQWPIYPFAQWWQGTVNNALGNAFSIDGNGDYIVYRTYEAKRAHPIYLGESFLIL